MVKNRKLTSLVTSIMWLQRNKMVPGYWAMPKDLSSSRAQWGKREQTPSLGWRSPNIGSGVRSLHPIPPKGLPAHWDREHSPKAWLELWR